MPDFYKAASYTPSLTWEKTLQPHHLEQATTKFPTPHGLQRSLPFAMVSSLTAHAATFAVSTTIRSPGSCSKIHLNAVIEGRVVEGREIHHTWEILPPPYNPHRTSAACWYRTQIPHLTSIHTQLLRQALLVGMFYLSTSFKPKYKTKCKRKVGITLILPDKELGVRGKGEKQGS